MIAPTRAKKLVMSFVLAAALAMPVAAFADCIRITTTTTYKVFGYQVYQTVESTVVCS